MENKAQNIFLFSLFFTFISIRFITSYPLEFQTHSPLLHSLPHPPTLSWPESKSSEPDPENSTTLYLHHIDALSFNKTPQQLFNLRLQRDTARVKTFTSLASSLNQTRPGKSGSGSSVSSSVVSGLALGSGEYFTRIGVGTPPRYVYMILDTGSDIVWLQCAPCENCYSQTDPVFDPKKSSSYAGISCLSPLCRRLDSPGCKGKRVCQYEVSYGDGSFTVGDFSTEMLTFGRTGVPRVAIGCGHDNEGLFNGSAGLFGLGRGGLSFPIQTAYRFKQKFSYCFVDRFVSNKPSSIVFGDSAIPRTVLFTPLIKNLKLPTFYYVELLGISVGGLPVRGISASLFRFDKTGDGGVIIDSGTSVTRLTRLAYVPLRNAFRIGTRHLKQGPVDELFDTCYDLAGIKELKIPTVVLHFRGADMNLPSGNLLVPVNTDKRTYCFAFAGTMRNIQQQGFRVTYDLAGSRVGFSPQGCV
ncbi:protein ASPARTIC PROTEASE IN GUARD CELL 1-like [Trifolium pratense]|uniref:Protein ASPARTIC PROTEASE IN GUARD CELL 1-like n=1 Tax=Trifolium pratense TaxID=57577 RepID=A0A2K3MU00_TRIPR|nr:protein ASPARTIC PROTEASE IN GUARD CELL 1-like [Trifolium pratense]